MTDEDSRQAFMFIARLISRERAETQWDLSTDAAAEVVRLRDLFWEVGKGKAPVPAIVATQSTAPSAPTCDDCRAAGQRLITKSDHHGGTKTVCADRDACHERERARSPTVPATCCDLWPDCEHQGAPK